MNRIKEIYDMLKDKESKEEISLDWKKLEEFEQESKIVMTDEIFSPFLDYVTFCEVESFKKGFTYAMQLMKECGQ